MNQIGKIRNEVKDFFDPRQLVTDSKECFISPSGWHRIETSNYQQNKADLNWKVTKVEVYHKCSQEKIFEFFGNDERFFHYWLEKDGSEYLVCAEDLFGGQTVLDLTNRRMESYSPAVDGFIWADFYLSPDGKTLAVIGCYWACPYVIKVYDFNKPLELPLKELNEIRLLETDETIIAWSDNNTLRMKTTVKTVDELIVEREVSVLKQQTE